MTRQRSTLRISALYHARGMISQSEYRHYRHEYLEALVADAELPELPEAWHQVVPGTHTSSPAEDEPVAAGKRSLPRTIVVFLAVAALAIGGLIALFDLA